MKDPFARPTASGPSVAQVLFPALDSAGTIPLVVDAGARNGIHLPPEFARRAEIMGFEPNPEEYRKLVSHTTDAERVGLNPSRFRTETYHPCALWDRVEERPFYITAGAGACTLMGETAAEVTSRMWLDGSDRPYRDVHTDIRSTVPVPCRPLDDLVGSGRTVDILKVDAEGAELAIFQGARRLFDEHRVLFVKSEFVFAPYYRVHPVLGHQHVFLHDQGLRLIDLDLNQPRYSRDRSRISTQGDRRLIYCGDAYYVLDPDRRSIGAPDLQRLAIACIAYGFNSLGVSLLRDAALVPPGRIEEIEQALARVGWKRRLVQAWNRFPHVVVETLARLGLSA